jgi:hypothetical protein
MRDAGARPVHQNLSILRSIRDAFVQLCGTLHPGFGAARLAPLAHRADATYQRGDRAGGIRRRNPAPEFAWSRAGICGLIAAVVSDQLDVLMLVTARLDAGALQKIDLIVLTSAEYEQEKFERRRRVEIGRQTMWMISPEDLVLSKLLWAKDSRSELQFRDVRSIITLQPNLDWPYLDRWAARITVAGLLREFRA